MLHSGGGQWSHQGCSHPLGHAWVGTNPSGPLPSRSNPAGGQSSGHSVVCELPIAQLQSTRAWLDLGWERGARTFGVKILLKLSSFGQLAVICLRNNFNSNRKSLATADCRWECLWIKPFLSILLCLPGWLLFGICCFGVGLLFHFILFFLNSYSLPRISNLRTGASV